MQAELQRTLRGDPRLAALAALDGAAEHLASGPQGADWTIAGLVRYGRWLPTCQALPETCALLAARREVLECGSINSNVLALHGGARLKPHFGNAPRYALHLPLLVPEPASFEVGGQRVFWHEGRAVVFDDTFVHKVTYDGSATRIILNVWFCTEHLHSD